MTVEVAVRPEPSAPAAATARMTGWLLGAWTGRQRLVLGVVLGVAAAVRVAWVLHAARRPEIGDPVSYFYYGEQMARGHGYHSAAAALTEAAGNPEVAGTPPPSAFYPIGYPGALAIVFWVVLHTPIPDNLPMTVGFFHAVLGVSTVAIMAAIARRLFGPRVGLVAAALVALFPNLVYFTATANQETLLIFLTMAAILIAVAGPWPQGRWSWSRLVAFGLVLGLSGLVKPFTLIVLPGLVVAWLLAGTGWRRSLTQATVVVVAFAVPLVPWVIRNQVRMDAAVVSTGIGDALCTGHHEGASGAFEVVPECLDGYEHLPLDRREVERNSDNTRRAVEFALEHPLDEARLLFWRTYYGFRDDHDAILAIDPGGANVFDDRWRSVLITAGDAYYYVVVAFAAVGFPSLFRRRSPPGAFLALAVLGLASLPLMLFGDPRYHVAVLPLLAVVGAVPLSALLDRWWRRRGAPPPTGVTSA